MTPTTTPVRGSTSVRLLDRALRGKHPGGPAPAQFVGGLADLRPGVHGWVTLDLPPGRYGVWSIEDGDFTDVLNGLTTTFTVRDAVHDDR